MPITRQEILDRAVVWVEHGIRYSQLRYHKEAQRGNTEMAYRTDCSGYVAMAWKTEVAPSTSHYASTNPSKLFRRIACNELLPGDALVTKGKGHIALFREWLSQRDGSFTAWEEANVELGTVAQTRSFNKDMRILYAENDAHKIIGSSKLFLCLRRNNIIETVVGAPCSGIRGTCIDTSRSVCRTRVYPWGCPGSWNIKCCRE